MCQKAPTRAVTDSELLKYSDLLTLYAFEIRVRRTHTVQLSSLRFLCRQLQPRVIATSVVALPCMHMFKLRRTSNVPVFASSLCAERWGKNTSWRTIRYSRTPTVYVSRACATLASCSHAQHLEVSTRNTRWHFMCAHNLHQLPAKRVAINLRIGCCACRPF